MMRLGVTLVLLFAFAAASKNAWMCNVPVTVDDSFAAVPTILGNSFENYNLISFGSVASTSGDVEGAVAARNNLKAKTYSIGAERFTAGPGAWDTPLQYSAIFGGNVSWTSGALYRDAAQSFHAGPVENMYVGGSTAGTQSDLVARANGGNSGNLNSVFDAAQTYYRSLSSAFAGLSATVPTLVQYSGITINCPSTAAQQIVVSLTAAQMSSVTYYTVNTGCNIANSYVFNIVANGQNVKFSGDWMPQAIPFENILYNVIGSGRVTLQGASIRGSLLAPDATYNNPTGTWWGYVIVGDNTQMNQINRPHCPPHPVPNTPSTCVSWETECAGLHFTPSGTSEVDSFVEYNAVVFGDFTANTGDVEGRLAVGGTATFGNGYSVGARVSTANNSPNVHQYCSLIVNGDLNWGSGALYPNSDDLNSLPGSTEFACVHGSTTTTPDLAQRVVSSSDLSSVFSAAQTCYCGMSNTLANQAVNTQHTIQYSGLFVTCNSASASNYVINLTPAEFSQFTYTNLDGCNFQARWTINVVGSGDVTISGDSFPAVPAGVVYNVIGQRTVNLVDTQLNGAFLGCQATLNQPSGVIIGKVVAAKVQMMNQINAADRCQTVVDVILNIVATQPAAKGSHTIVVASPSSLRVGDKTTLGVITAINGNTITLDTPLSQDYSAGVIAGTVRIASDSGRAQVANVDSDKSSASMVGVAVASIAVAALLI